MGILLKLVTNNSDAMIDLRPQLRKCQANRRKEGKKSPVGKKRNEFIQLTPQ